MIGRVAGYTLMGFAMGALGLALASRHADARTRRARLLKISVYFVIVQSFLAAAAFGRVTLAALCVAVVIAGAWELRQATEAIDLSLRWTSRVIYVMVAATLIAFTIRSPISTVVFVYLVVAAFDGFSQVAGQLAGRRRLAPSISPQKTVAGLAGGVVAALIAAVSFQIASGLSIGGALLVAAAAVPGALAGDLASSFIKRRAGIKDFSALVPGHGGVLDRFDSLLGAAAMVTLALELAPEILVRHLVMELHL